MPAHPPLAPLLPHMSTLAASELSGSSSPSYGPPPSSPPSPPTVVGSRADFADVDADDSDEDAFSDTCTDHGGGDADEDADADEALAARQRRNAFRQALHSAWTPSWLATAAVAADPLALPYSAHAAWAGGRLAAGTARDVVLWLLDERRGADADGGEAEAALDAVLAPLAPRLFREPASMLRIVTGVFVHVMRIALSDGSGAARAGARARNLVLAVRRWLRCDPGLHADEALLSELLDWIRGPVAYRFPELAQSLLDELGRSLSQRGSHEGASRPPSSPMGSAGRPSAQSVRPVVPECGGDVAEVLAQQLALLFNEEYRALPPPPEMLLHWCILDRDERGYVSPQHRLSALGQSLAKLVSAMARGASDAEVRCDAVALWLAVEKRSFDTGNFHAAVDIQSALHLLLTRAGLPVPPMKSAVLFRWGPRGAGSCRAAYRPCAAARAQQPCVPHMYFEHSEALARARREPLVAGFTARGKPVYNVAMLRRVAPLLAGLANARQPYAYARDEAIQAWFGAHLAAMEHGVPDPGLKEPSRVAVATSLPGLVQTAIDLAHTRRAASSEERRRPQDAPVALAQAKARLRVSEPDVRSSEDALATSQGAESSCGQLRRSLTQPRPRRLVFRARVFAALGLITPKLPAKTPPAPHDNLPADMPANPTLLR